MSRLLSRCIIEPALFLAILGTLYACARSTPTITPSPDVTSTVIPSATLVITTPTPESTATRTPVPQPRTLTICMFEEPDTLYINGGNMLAAANIWAAIYDGPIDSTGYSFHPVILEKLPSLADGDAIIKPVEVKDGDSIVNDSGEVVTLVPGQVVRPYGCTLSDCAVSWHGEPLWMDQMSATFTLMENIRWSDGEPLTADDSVFGFNRASYCRIDQTIMCGSLGLGGISLTYTIDRTASYSALDERTTLWVGLPGFLDPTYMTNFAHPLPRHQLSRYTPQQLYGLEDSSVHPMGWGAYVIDQWKYGEYIRLSKNPYYFKAGEGLPHFDQLIFSFTAGGDENAILSALQNGKCDLIDQHSSQWVTLNGVLEANDIGEVKAVISPGTSWDHLDFNIRPAKSILNSGAFAGWDLDGDGQGPFGDVRLRQAIAMCLDRQAVVDTVYIGHSLVPDTYLPPNHPLFNAQATHWSYDPASASVLLDEIGWNDTDNYPVTRRVAVDVTGVPDGTPLLMNYETTNSVLRQQVGPILAESLAGCGIQLDLSYHPASEWFAAGPDGRLYGHLFDLGELAFLSGIVPPCDLFLSGRLPTVENNWTGNTTGFNDQAYDAACVQQLQSLPGGADYSQAALEAQRIFAQQLPVVPLFYRIKYAAARPDLCGYILDPTAQSDFWNIEAYDYREGCK